MIVLKDYQKKIVDSEKRSNPGCNLFLTMGAGKTLVSIQLIKKFQLKKVLILSKSNIIKNTWPNEIEKWELPYRYINLANRGTKELLKFLGNHDNIPDRTVCGINYDILSQSKTKNKPKRIDLTRSPLLKALIDVEWDCIIIDESTKIKDPTSTLTLAILNLTYNKPNAYVMALTGTPNPETNIELYTQISVVDRGRLFGESFYAWRAKYFYQEKYSFKWKLFPFVEDKIQELIKDRVHIVTKEEIKNLPPMLEYDIIYNLNEKEKAYYKAMKKDNIITIKDKDITAANAGVALSKLMQITSGFIYEDAGGFERNTIFFGNSKIDALLTLLDQIDGKVIVCYNFQASHDLITMYLNLNDIEWVDSNNITDRDFITSIHKVLLLQPKSGAYGSNYQEATNNLIWYEIDVSGERFEQTNKRYHREGQTKTCYMYFLIAKNTHDKQLVDRVKAKDVNAQKFLNEIKTQVDDDKLA